MRNIRESDATGSLHPASGLPREGATRRRDRARSSGVGPIALAATIALGGLLLQAGLATAVEFDENGYRGSLDTILSHGLTIRVEERDGAAADDVNSNDGNLNYDRGVVSNTSKFTSDLDIRTGDFGVFVRATGFLDFENQNGERERTPLSDEAKERVGSDVEILDAYFTTAFDAVDMPIDVRLGRHVLNWGESTYIPSGISSINPFDVSRLRTPGSELREALLPVTMLSVQAAPTDTLSVEAFYQFGWEETRIDPVGSYFSVTDYVGPGAERAVVPLFEGLTDEGFEFGRLTPAISADLTGFETLIPGVPTPIPLPQPPLSAIEPDFLNVTRTADRDPGNSGQGGVALRYLAAELNDTEFGFYLLNYHSRLPLVRAITGTNAGLQAGLFAAQAVSAPDSNTVTALTRTFTPLVTPHVTQAFNQRITETVGAQIPVGTPGRDTIIAQQVAAQLAAPATQQLIQEEIGKQVDDRVSGQLRDIVRGLAIDRYVKTGSYFIEYPEDNRTLGLSFNTLLGASGWALQGEYSFRPDTPLQMAEQDLFADGLRPILTGLELLRRAGAAAAAAQAAPTPENLQAAQQAAAAYGAYVTNYQPRLVQGYVEHDVSQIQATATKVFGPVLGSDSGVFLTEVALMHVHSLPDQTESRLESPAGGDCRPALEDIPAAYDACAEGTSWGYRVAARLDYNNAIGAVNLFPYVQLQHDVSGNSPAPIGPFVEGRTALTLGLRADYLSRWQADFGFTRYAGDANELQDRDFISASVKYSF